MRSRLLLAAAMCSVAMNAAFVVRLLIRHREAQVLPVRPDYMTPDAVDSRIFAERSARFASLKPAPADVLFVGDSIAAAIVSDLEDREREGDLPLRWNGLSVHGRCVPSITTTGLVSILPMAESLKARIIFIWCGTNDLGMKRPLDQVATTYDGIVFELQKTCPNSRIIILSLLPIRFNDDWNAKTKEFNAALARIANAHKLQFVDLSADVSDSSGRLDESITQDGVHPMASGLFKIEKHLASVLP